MGSKSCPRLPFSVSWLICLKEAECSTEGDDVAFPSERCAALQKFCTPCKSEHCPETLTTGEVSLLHFPPKLYLKPQGRWVEICKMRLCSSSLTCAHRRALGIAVPAMKGQKKMGSTSGAVSSHATAPGQPLQGHLLCSCLRCCLM